MMDGELFIVADDVKVHPLAAIFPMLSEDELDDLAADIKANGLLHPIVRMIDHKTIVDGRNRYEACRRAEVQPDFDDRIRNDAEARALIVSANLQRRNLTKSQQAMALAMIVPEPKHGGDRRSSLVSKLETDVHKTRLSQARFVLRMGPDDLAPGVIAGTKNFDEALIEARQRQNKATSDETQTAKLRDEAPDLADLVTEERMSLPEAIAAARQRAEDRRQAIEAGRRASANLVDFAGVAVTIAAAAELGERGLVTAEQLARLDDAMTLLERIHEDDKNET
jgi:ParB-like chromosome segregation protein Spo0J